MPYGFVKGVASVVDILDVEGVSFMLRLSTFSTVCTD